jgi:Bacterial extracellular solute-binding proteins, family 5 Middle
MKARRLLPILVLGLSLIASVVPPPAMAQAQMTWAVHVSLAPVWFDPAEHTGIITLMKVLYAVHDAMVKPMPGNAMAPSLAESWTAARDGLSYEFVVRKGVVFHNGDPLTADDVKFSFDRYKGAAAKLLKEKVAAVEVVDPWRVRFRLKEPWPDFMTFYATPASGAGWIVPKKYVEKVGDEGFRKAPVGAGPYKLASFNPGVEMVLEAHDRYWRKTPAVKRLVWKVVLEDLTRLAMLKRGEVDVAYSLRGPLGEEVKRTAGLKLVPTVISATQWLDFGPLQWDPKSPWSDRRVRLAAALAFDKNAINQAETLGHSKPTGSIIPSAFEYALAIPPYPYDPPRARKLSPRPAIRTASTPATMRVTRRTRPWPRRSPATSPRWGSGPSCVRWSERPSSAIGRTRTSAPSCRRAPAGTATPPPGSRTTSPGTASTRGRAIPTWTTSSPSRLESSTPSAARLSFTRSSAWPTTGSCTRLCGNWGSSTPSGRAWSSLGSASSPITRIRRPTRT